jgi:hypothetical protein
MFSLQLPSDISVAIDALAYELSSRWLGDKGFFQPVGTAYMLGVLVGSGLDRSAAPNSDCPANVIE